MKKWVEWLRIVSALGILALMAWIVVNHDVHFGRVQAAVIFLLGGLLAGLLVGTEVANRLTLSLGGLAITLVGAAAVTGAVAGLLWYMAKPEEIISAFDVVDEKNEPVLIAADGVLQVTPTEGAGDLTVFRRGATFVVILPREHKSILVSVKPLSRGAPLYQGEVKNPPSARVRLKLGTDLAASQ